MQLEANNEYVSCNWVNSGLEFRKDCIRICCYGYLQTQDDSATALIENYNGEKIDWDDLLAKKQKLKELNKNGVILPACKNCIYLEKKKWDEEVFIDHITLNHWSKCNCNCTYCYTADEEKSDKNKKNYNILPIFKEMYEKNILRPTSSSCIAFGGGEPTILEDFDKLIDFLLSKGFRNIRINSSGIKYSKSIEKGLMSGAISLVISPDSGTKETYNKIKRTNSFNKVWDNIKKYAKISKEPNLLKVKYIIISEINDNKEEIDKWFGLVLKNNVKAVSLSVEQHWYFQNNPNFPDSIYEIIDYIKNKAEQLNLELEIYCEALSVLNLKEKS